MGFFKKLAGVFGFGQEVLKNEEDDIDVYGDGGNQQRFRETGLPRKGFGVPVQVAVERSQLGPLLQPCANGDGGIQVWDSCAGTVAIVVDCFIRKCGF
jgi:hypothetical protein